MLVGETIQLKATVLPSDAVDNTVKWDSSNQSVASVDNSGVVTAVSEGDAVISASAGGKSATCKVTVSRKVVPVESVSLDKDSMSLVEGESSTLVATVSPADATDKTVNWSSSNQSVASVDNSGVVTAVSEGESIITASAGEKYATCKVTVSKKVVPVESVSLDKVSVSLVEGESCTLVATVSPSNASDKTVTWSSSKQSVATVDSGVVTAVSEGESTITASAGGKSATCKVIVSKKVIPVESVSLDKDRLYLTVGGNELLIATVIPDDASDKTVKWSSSDVEVATVDRDGLVTAVKGGTATVSAVAGSQSATAFIDVMAVSPSVASVEEGGGSFSIEVITTRKYHLSSQPDWVKEKSVKNQIHTFEAEANPLSKDRSGVVVFCDDFGTCFSCIINQAGAKPILEVNPSTFSFDEEGGKADMDVVSNTSWKVSSDMPWCKVSPAGGEGNGVISMEVGSNTSVEMRSATIRFEYGNQSFLAVVVTQAGADFFSITPEKVSLAAEGGSFEISVSASSDYEVTSRPDWVEERSVTEKTHVFEVGANPLLEERRGEVVFTNTRGLSLSCEVTQAAKQPYIRLSSDILSFDFVGGASTVDILSNVKWTVVSDASWCEVSPTSGEGDASLNVKVGDYKKEGNRSAVVTVSAEGGLVQTISVEQEGVVQFGVSPSLVDVDMDGGSFEVKVSSSFPYHISSIPDWVTDITGTPVDNTHKFKVGPIPGPEPRSGVIVFCDEVGTCLPVSVRQEGNPYIIDWNVDFYHKSLFMSFTTTRANWYPRMAKGVSLAQSRYPGKIETVNLHVSSSGIPFADSGPLVGLYGVNSYPTGVVDGRRRLGYNHTSDNAASMIGEFIEETEAVYPVTSAIGFDSSIDGDVLKLNLRLYLKKAGNYKVTALLLESGIVGYQADAENGAHQDYRHDNVARMALTEVTGDAFTVTSDCTFKKVSYTASVPDGYKKENLRILVIVQRAFGSQPIIVDEGYDYGGYYVDNCISGKVGSTLAPSLVGETNGGNEDFTGGKPIDW